MYMLKKFFGCYFKMVLNYIFHLATYFSLSYHIRNNLPNWLYDLHHLFSGYIIFMDLSWFFHNEYYSLTRVQFPSLQTPSCKRTIPPGPLQSSFWAAFRGKCGLPSSLLPQPQEQDAPAQGCFSVWGLGTVTTWSTATAGLRQMWA